ncbi:MAG: response regulator [Candidatus Pacearchaeota archaeon]|nr:response regulator [Candidatus Pacearchaeota archaeon]
MANSTYRILVIDDHPQTATAISTILQNEGFSVSEAYNEKSAERECKSERFNLMIIDIDMPMACSSENPKILITSFKEPGSKIKKFKNVVGIIKKPISSEELIGVVKKALGVR